MKPRRERNDVYKSLARPAEKKLDEPFFSKQIEGKWKVDLAIKHSLKAMRVPYEVDLCIRDCLPHIGYCKFEVEIDIYV